MSGGDGGPTAVQKQAQAEQVQLAEEAQNRELARERALKVRVLARQRARRFGQFGRESLAFNPGRKDLTTEPETGTGGLPFGIETRKDVRLTVRAARLTKKAERIEGKKPNRAAALRRQAGRVRGRTTAGIANAFGNFEAEKRKQTFKTVSA